MLKMIHVATAYLSFLGFIMRGAWLFLRREKPGRVAKRARDIVDTALLLSAIGLAWAYGLNPLHHGWLLAKLVFLLMVIVSGVLAVRFYPKQPHSLLFWLIAFAAYLAIFAFAHSKP